VLSSFQPTDYFTILLACMAVFVMNRPRFSKTKIKLHITGNKDNLITFTSVFMVLIGILNPLVATSTAILLTWCSASVFVVFSLKNTKKKKSGRGRLKKHLLLIPACLGSNLVLLDLFLQPTMIHSIWIIVTLSQWIKVSIDRHQQTITDLNAVKSKLSSLNAQSHNEQLRVLSKVPNDKWPKAS